MSQNILHVENITMQFGGVVAVNNLSVDVNSGEIVALIGPNGCLLYTSHFLRLGLLTLGAGKFLLHQGGPLLQDAVCLLYTSRPRLTNTPCPAIWSDMGMNRQK